MMQPVSLSLLEKKKTLKFCCIGQQSAESWLSLKIRYTGNEAYENDTSEKIQEKENFISDNIAKCILC